MEKRPISLNSIAEEAGNGAKALWGKTKDSFVKVADQNNDGTFDMNDVTAIAETIGSAAQTQPMQLKPPPTKDAASWKKSSSSRFLRKIWTAQIF